MLSAARVISRKALDCSKYSIELGGKRGFSQILNNVSGRHAIFVILKCSKFNFCYCYMAKLRDYCSLLLIEFVEVIFSSFNSVNRMKKVLEKCG